MSAGRSQRCGARKHRLDALNGRSWVQVLDILLRHLVSDVVRLANG
jgi:hypothetical protein